MENDQTRCPQCGATVRPSARFCVTCGIRLPDPASSERQRTEPAASGWRPRDESPWGSPPPAPADQEAATQSWPNGSTEDVASATPEATADSSATADSPPPPAGVDEAASTLDADAAPVIQSSGWETWTSSTTDVIAIPIDDDSATITDGVDMLAEPVEEQTDGESVSEMPASVAVAEPNASDIPFSSEIAVSDDAAFDQEAEPVNPADLPVAERDDAAEIEPEDDGNGGERLSDALEPEQEEEFEPAGWTEIEEEIAESNPEIAAQSRSSPAWAGSGDEHTASSGSDPFEPLVRAQELISELQALLPTLAPPPVEPAAAPEPEAPTPAVDLHALRESARAARGEVSFDDFASLRTVTQDAMSRPRDVEVVLRLSQRIEDIDALLQERDRLQSAFDQLIAHLDAVTGE